MGNYLSIRRVKVQTVDENGHAEGDPTFGVMAADDYGQAYNDSFESLEELNDAINETGCILDIVDRDRVFSEICTASIGTENFFEKVYLAGLEP